MELHTALLLTITMSASLHEGFGRPLMGQADPGDTASVPKMRTRRCSCNNQLDSECHYFCHLDIIWVNTPSKTTVYGLGSPIARRRRSTGRCLCANPGDRTCKSFCLQSSDALLGSHGSMQGKPEQQKADLPAARKVPEEAAPNVLLIRASSVRTRPDLLTVLRNVVKAQSQALQRGASPSHRGSKARKHGYK